MEGESMREIRKFPKLDSKAIAKAFIAKELVSDKMRVCKKSDPDDHEQHNQRLREMERGQ